MHQEYYDAGKLAARAAGWGIFALFCFWVGGFFGVMVGAASLLVTMAFVAKATGDRVAIRFGQDQVELHGLGRSVTMRWDEVEDVTLISMKSRLFGFLPTLPTIQLTLIDEKNRKPLEIGVPVRLLALDRDGLMRLVKVMIMARAGGYDLVDPETGELHSAAAAQVAAEPTAPPAFGRKGL
jgi:hypothetical protein